MSNMDLHGFFLIAAVTLLWPELTLGTTTNDSNLTNSSNRSGTQRRLIFGRPYFYGAYGGGGYLHVRQTRSTSGTAVGGIIGGIIFLAIMGGLVVLLLTMRANRNRNRGMLFGPPGFGPPPQIYQQQEASMFRLNPSSSRSHATLNEDASLSNLESAPPVRNYANPAVQSPPLRNQSPPLRNSVDPAIHSPPPRNSANPTVQSPPPRNSADPPVQSPPPRNSADPPVQSPPPRNSADPPVQSPQPRNSADPPVQSPPPRNSADPAVHSPTASVHSLNDLGPPDSRRAS